MKTEHSLPHLVRLSEPPAPGAAVIDRQASGAAAFMDVLTAELARVRVDPRTTSVDRADPPAFEHQRLERPRESGKPKAEVAPTGAALAGGRTVEGLDDVVRAELCRDETLAQRAAAELCLATDASVLPADTGVSERAGRSGERASHAGLAAGGPTGDSHSAPSQRTTSDHVGGGSAGATGAISVAERSTGHAAATSRPESAGGEAQAISGARDTRGANASAARQGNATATANPSGPSSRVTVRSAVAEAAGTGSNQPAGGFTGAAAGPTVRAQGDSARLLDRLSGSGARPVLSAEPMPAAMQAGRAMAQAVRDGEGAVTLRLTPEALGQVTIRMTIESGVVSAVIECATSEGHDALQGGTEALRASMESRGLNVGTIELVPLPPAETAEDPWNSGASGDDARRHEGGRGQPDREPSAERDDERGGGSETPSGDNDLWASGEGVAASGMNIDPISLRLEAWA